MTLLGAILKKVQSKESCVSNKLGGATSPPPELDVSLLETHANGNKKKRDRFAHVVPRVDSAPPRLYSRQTFQQLARFKEDYSKIYADNIRLVMAIKAQHFSRGKVECRWKHPLKQSQHRHRTRQTSLRQIETDNNEIYNKLNAAYYKSAKQWLFGCTIYSQKPRVASTRSLLREWSHTCADIVRRAHKPFLLFPLETRELLEDPVFAAPDGVTRPRVYISLRVKRGAALGSLCVELFSELCPRTCQLFLDLLDGDGLGYGYVATRFFRKVPHLYWSGGDVIHDNGFGCYSQRGRRVPISAENYHFPHSMPGLLSMRVTSNDEMCGIFNITFKALPQFDLKNVVFGRVIRPSSTFDTIRSVGTALGSNPVVQIDATRRFQGSWIHGAPNLKLVRHPNRLKAFLKADDVNKN